MNKILFSISLLLCLPITSTAQHAGEETKAELKHEISLSVGQGSHFDFLSDDANCSPCSVTPLEKYNSSKYYYDTSYNNPSLNIAYRYHLNSRWTVGGTSAAWFRNHYKFSESDNRQVFASSDYRFSLLAGVRYYYWETNISHFYSGLAGGATLAADKDIKKDKYEYRFMPAYQLTLIGVTLGKDFYGFADLGYGTLGVLNLGLGYKF